VVLRLSDPPRTAAVRADDDQPPVGGSPAGRLRGRRCSGGNCRGGSAQAARAGFPGDTDGDSGILRRKGRRQNVNYARRYRRRSTSSAWTPCPHRCAADQPYDRTSPTGGGGRHPGRHRGLGLCAGLRTAGGRAAGRARRVEARGAPVGTRDGNGPRHRRRYGDGRSARESAGRRPLVSGLAKRASAGRQTSSGGGCRSTTSMWK